MALPLRDNSIDVVVCNHIYEHVPLPSQMLDEIYRVLKEDGFCYFSAGNKYAIMEGHHYLPMLSWFPKPLAHLYLKFTGKGSFYYEQRFSLRELKQLVKKFRIHDYTLSIIRNPEKFSSTDLIHPKSFLYKGVQLTGSLCISLDSHLYLDIDEEVMKHLNYKQIFRWIIVIVIFLYLGKMVWDNWIQVRDASFYLQPFPLILSTLLFAFSYFIQIWAWYFITLKLDIATFF